MPFLNWESDFLVLFLNVLDCEIELMVDNHGLFEIELGRSDLFGEIHLSQTNLINSKKERERRRQRKRERPDQSYLLQGVYPSPALVTLLRP